MANWWEEQDNLDYQIIEALQGMIINIPGIKTAPITNPKSIDKANLPMSILWPGAGQFRSFDEYNLTMNLSYVIEVAIEPLSQGYSNLWVTRQKSQILRTSFWELFGNQDNMDFLQCPGYCAEIDGSRDIVISGLLPSPNEGDYLQYSFIDYYGIRVTLPITASGKGPC